MIFTKATEAVEKFDQVIRRLTHVDQDAVERQAAAKQEKVAKEQIDSDVAPPSENADV